MGGRAGSGSSRVDNRGASVGLQINAPGSTLTLHMPSQEPRRANLPPPPDRLVGRAPELYAIHQMLYGPVGREAGERACVLMGLAGVGKSALAAVYARDHIKEYTHICWVNAGGADIDAAFAGLAEDPLRLDAVRDATVPRRVVAVKQALEAASGQVLLVLDNVDHPRRWRALVPMGEHVAVLITTRREDVAGTNRVHVGVLCEESALTLLLGDVAATPLPEREAARALYEELGGLTLAVALAARLLEQPGARVSMLLDRVRRSGPVRWSEVPRGEELLDRNPSLARLFQASVGLLDPTEAVDAHALRLLKVGGWFAPVPIPRALLLAAAAMLAGEAIGPDHEEDALARLSNLGLAQIDDDGRPRLHRLIAACARALEGAGSETVLDALAELAQATPTDTLSLLGLAAIAPHMAEATTRIDAASPEPHLRIALRLAQHCKHVARYTDGLALCERLASTLGDSVWASYFHNEGGQALSRQGLHTEALAHFERDLAIKERTLGSVHPETAITLHAIGRTLHRQRDFVEALRYFDRALHIYEVTHALDGTGAATTLTAKGQSLSRLGRHAEALKVCRRALEIKEKELGPTHPDAAMSQFEVGRGLRELGDPEGEQRMRAAVEVLTRLLGAEHPYVQAARSWLR